MSSRSSAVWLSRIARLSRTGLGFHLLTLAALAAALAFRQGHPAMPSPALVVFAVLAWLPLLVRNRWPLAVLGVVTVIEAVHVASFPYAATSLVPTIGFYQPVPIATMAAVWTVASRRRPLVGWSFGVAAAVVLQVTSLITQPSMLLGPDMVMFNLVVLATAAGVLATVRRDRAARQAREQADHITRQVMDERLRIARDLHDVLAHHLTLVNAQAGVAEYLLRTDTAAAATALRDITENTKRALDEVRTTVGLLRHSTEGPAGADPLGPVPGLDRLDELLGRLRSGGVDISRSVTGAPAAVSPATDLAAYRIIQEALTNATKHAPGARIDLTLDWSEAALRLRIVNRPGHVAARRAAGGGHGLIGMRERATNCGGSLLAEPTPDGGFAVTASLPALGTEY
ncbi:MAG TPA: histidine kinase [Pseudonocardiaceae bacterium]|jgi:signal transduction histidine kinase|nr:histidine kinase [Pseudonocardiaceae bacterium]